MFETLTNISVANFIDFIALDLSEFAKKLTMDLTPF